MPKPLPSSHHRSCCDLRIEVDGKTVTCERAGRLSMSPPRRASTSRPCAICPTSCPGYCRVCSVKVNGAVAAACAVKVSDGMRVEVDEPETTERVKRWWRCCSPRATTMPQL